MVDKVPDNVVDKQLYQKIKKEVYKEIPQHSAYRSGILVKKYKEAGGKYKGKEKKDEGLNRWFAEKWETDKGKIGYRKPDDVYRPTIRITKDTPTTFNELSKKQIENAKKQKLKTGRVKKFDV